MFRFKNQIEGLVQSFLGAVSFYTIIPLPSSWQVNWQQIARWTALLGILLGGFLGVIDTILSQFNFPDLTRSGLIVAIWLFLTGGLHLDGVMDTADGLAVTDPKRRIEVMQDSHSGAFGVMAAAIVLLLKTLALSDIEAHRCYALMGAAGWGRWGQTLAIAAYPYLKATGKGAFHKENIHLPQDVLIGLLGLLGLSVFYPIAWEMSIVMAVFGSVIATLTGYWFYRQLGGHTGDTYGAVVEWTEVFYLCCLTGVMSG